MAVREFNGTSDYIQLGSTGATIGAGAVSIVALMRCGTRGTGSQLTYVSAARTTSNSALVEMGAGTSNDQLQYYNYVDGPNAAFARDDTLPWEILGISKAAGGGVVVRCHSSQHGTWLHTNTAAIGSVPSDSWSLTNIGRRGTGSNFAAFKLAVVAIFNKQLSDADYESIGTGASTASISALGPVTLWEFNQTSVSTIVEDLIGSADETARSGTTVVTGDDPTWTFSTAAAPATTQSGLLLGVG